MIILKNDEIVNKIKEFGTWKYTEGKLIKEFICKNFIDSLSLVVKIGMLAEKINHHPNINLHSWNKVKVVIFTHSVSGITEKDFELLELIEKN